MTDFRERYKRLGFDPEANRALRSQRRDEARRGLRDEQMSLRREMGTRDRDDSYLLDENNTTANTQESSFSGCTQDNASYKSANSHEDSKTKATAEYEAAVQQRWERLQKWREEKNKRKIIEKKKAKPVFKVGVVHHRIYSPPVSKEPAPLPPLKLCRSRDISANMSHTAPKRVTRATEKRLAVKTLKDQQKRENMRSKKKTQPKVHAPTNEDKVKIAPKDHIFKAPLGVTPMPIFGRQALEATKESIQAEIDSFHISKKTIPPDFNESFNESAISLKLSSDEQEMHDDSVTKEAQSPVSQHSLKNRSPSIADDANVKGVAPSDQEMMEVEHFSKTEKRNGNFSTLNKIESPVGKRKRKSVVGEPKEITINSPRLTRSTVAADKRKSARIASTDSNDSGIRPNLTPGKRSGNRSRSTRVIASASIDFETDSISTPDKEVKPSTNRRKSLSKIVPSESTANEPMPTPPAKQTNKRRSSKLIKSRITDNGEDTFVKPAANRRRSTKIISETDTLNSGNIVTIADVHHSPLANEEPNRSIVSPTTKKSIRFNNNGQENIDFNNTNLMDFTFSAPVKTPKLTAAPKSLLDDSVTNLTPRRSPRLPATTTAAIDEDQPLIRFSAFYLPAPAMNESSSSEPMKQRSPNEIMNLSLNMSLPKETEEDKPPAFFSPYIVQSRGKNSARKEMKKKRFSQSGLNSEDIPTKDNIMMKLNISVDEEERTAQYYKYILDKEIERLNELCDRWNMVKEHSETPEEIRYIIQAACGQTQLLINKKFERFRGLVNDCETGRGEMLVTCKDLQGFWDMMYMEINDCDSRFNKLEEMKANNWISKEDEIVVKEIEKKKKKAVVKKPVAKKPVAGKSSSLRAMIAAARKKKAQADGDEGSEETSTESIEKSVGESSNAGKPMGALKINSRRVSTPKSIGKWNNLLKKMEFSQTRKATTSPLVMMKVSQMIKTPEVQLDDSIVYINSRRTPAKSILKKDEVMGSVSKSTNKVFFREQSNEIKEFESRNSFVDCNMSLDNIEEMKEPIERKLNFEDASFVENTEENDKLPEIISSASHLVSNLSDGSLKNLTTASLMTSPMISMSPLSLEDKKSESSSTKKKFTRTKKQISFKENADENQLRSLRNRKFSAPLTPIPKHRNQKNIEEDMSMDMSASVSEDTKNDTPRQELVKEIYLNEQGVVCERFVSIEKSTLKNTPKPKRRNANVPEIQITTPKATLKEMFVEGKPSTPRSKSNNLKKSLVDVTLTHDNIDISMEEAKTPKLSKRTPKTSKTKSESRESSTQSSTLKRTRSLKLTDNEENIVNQTASPKLRRAKSLNIKKIDVKDSPKEALKRKSTKAVKMSQENIEPNQQEADRIAKEKLSKTSSFKRQSAKKQLEAIDPSEKLTDVSGTVNDRMTPNTRRKSLRITRASIRNEN